MEFVHEVTAYLENKPGRLAKICSALAQAKINVRALSVMDANGRSVLRMVTDDTEPTKKVLTSLGTEHSWSDVLAVEMDNKPGSLARVLERLAEEHINVEYAYVSNATSAGRSTGDLPHVEPEEGAAGPERHLGLVRRQRAGGPSPAPCPLTTASSARRRTVERARLHVVLFEPEIAANAGAIGRTCVAAGAALWLVRPLGFHLDDRHRRRAGLDYWPHLALRLVDGLDDVIAHFGPERLWWFSTRADRPYTTAAFREGDALLFGPESRGLPAPRLEEASRSAAPCASRSAPRRGASTSPTPRRSPSTRRSGSSSSAHGPT